MYNSSPLLQPFILSALTAAVDLALVIVHDTMCGFLIREGQKPTLFPKQTGCQDLANPAGSTCWSRSSLLPLLREPCSAPALPARQTPGEAGQSSFTECPKEGILLNISALWHRPVSFFAPKLCQFMEWTDLNSAELEGLNPRIFHKDPGLPNFGPINPHLS